MSAPAGTAKMRWGLWCGLLAALALLVVLAIGMTRDPRELPSALIGKPWPAMALPVLQQDAAETAQFSGPEQWRGQPRLINLWASWCATCGEEHPALMALADTLKAKGRADQLIGLNYKDKTENAAAWLQRLGNPYASSLSDAQGKLAIELGVYGAPESFVIDAAGVIVWKHVGALTPQLIAKEVMPRLEATQ
jgi:cytochrome c biogenesis protein CcmG/thiol:disulfide interchange protein DsbE